MQTETLGSNVSLTESQKPDIVISQDKKKDDTTLLTAENCIITPVQSFGMYNTLIYKNMEFIDDNRVVFISGCNLIVYDLTKKTCEYLIRKNPRCKITSMSIGNKTPKEPYVCLGEYNPETGESQISAIDVNNGKRHYTLKYKTETSGPEWKIQHSTILLNSTYLIAIHKRDETLATKISFWKYNHEKFISEVSTTENILNVSYNPQNCLELIVCGKGYLRLWNVFINDGTLKEHPQRFLKGKQEKEVTFISATFFENKSFMFLVGTLQNLFYIIEGFKIIFELKTEYEIPNTVDLNIDKILEGNTEESDDEDLSGNNFTTTNNNILSNSNKDKDLEDKEKEVFEEKKELDKSMKKKDSLTGGTSILENPLKAFILLSNSLVLFAFQEESFTMIYRLEKEFKKNFLERPKGSIQKSTKENSIFKLANNIEKILNIIINSDKSKIIYICQLKQDSTKRNSETRICFYLFSRVGAELKFDKEVFKEFFYYDEIKGFQFSEKKKIIYAITKNNWIRIFDYNNYLFYTKKNFKENVKCITASPHTNVFGLCFPSTFKLFCVLRNKIKIFCEFDVYNSYASFSHKGHLVALCGESKVDKNYCIYFLDAHYFNTIHAIEKVPGPAAKISWLNGDKMLVIMLENTAILGWHIDTEGMTSSLMYRIREQDRSIENFMFKPFYRYYNKSIPYFDFEYDYKNDLMILVEKVEESDSAIFTIITKLGRRKLQLISMNFVPSSIKVFTEIKSLCIGTTHGSIKLFKWPLVSPQNYTYSDVKSTAIPLEQNLITEVNLHMGPVSNIILSRNMKNLVSSSVDGSIYHNKLQFLKKGEYVDFDIFYGGEGRLVPTIDQTTRICDISEYLISYTDKTEQYGKSLDAELNRIKKDHDKLMINKNKEHEIEKKNLEDQRKDALEEERKKYAIIEKEVDELKNSIKNDFDVKKNEHEADKIKKAKKNAEKIQIYDNEIARLEKEKDTLQKVIETKFNDIKKNQNDYYKSLKDKYDKNFTDLNEKIEIALTKLVKTGAEYDEALFKNKEDYERIIQQIKVKKNSEIIKDKEEIASQEKKEIKVKEAEKQYEQSLGKWVADSEQIIQKNIQIKQNIIDTTQRTITLQEQLLETDKNLKNIKKKIEDLTMTNKHLEQTRMTSLEKEKAPLEGQCLFLEKQKVNLQDEFNKLILQINLKNQDLENMQSQLRASLIQNFEINDQISYMNKKLSHLHHEMETFISHYYFEDNIKSINENKPNAVAMKLREFYDKFFETDIERELNNYQFYIQKLTEETEKASISNNLDLIMRDKAEEKLISEKEKLVELNQQKEKVFHRMQAENTILITECNRLRKNLHEVYMHVVDIQKKFNSLTNVNPTLSKTDIVYRIKNFIKVTQEKIKFKFEEQNVSSDKPFNPYENQSPIGTKKANPGFESMFKGLDDHNEKLNNADNIMLDMKNQIGNINNESKEKVQTEKEEEGYDGLILPEINRADRSDYDKESKNSKASSKHDGMPNLNENNLPDI